ncbi:TPM domain-containing protein [Oceanobacillus polygoni]|uniref:TPM domain-containing protein n=1 Tax=Oceanobacillus polygoni TaxID=1235259 RepID=A0A9X1CDK5_9BACI|nr:TPM domain-containing protein [Oceanobacillus polygoni]MBP2079884.1 uncharacterized protein [Oceanobacillus polygoni]
MSRRFLTLSILFTSLFIFIFSIPAVEASSKQYIYDSAELLSEEQVMELEDSIKEFGDKQETDFIIHTTNDTGGKSIKTYMGDFYDEHAFGYDQPKGNTILLTVSMDPSKREVYLAGFKKGEEYLDNERIELVLDKVTPHLSDKNFYQAFQQAISTSSDYMEYRPGVNPESLLLKTWFQLVVALAVGGIIVGIMVYNSGGRVTVTARTYFNENNTRVNSKRDMFVNKTVTKRRKPSNNKSRGGRGGGGGITGGGSSFSGGGRSF